MRALAMLVGFAASCALDTTALQAAKPRRTWTIYIAQDKHLDYNWCGTTTEIEMRMVALVDFYLAQAEQKRGRWNLDGTLWADVYHRHRGDQHARKHDFLPGHPPDGHLRPHVGRAYRPRYPLGPYGYDYGYGYDVYVPGLYPPYPPYYDPYYIPPLYLPAEAIYGPQAVKRFMGWDNWRRPRANVNIIVPPGNAQGAANAPKQQKPNLRGTSQQSLSLAWKFIGYGDAHFANQKYSEAYNRYRKAARTAPRLADGYFRQGYALMATGHYDLAARAIKRGLGLHPEWPRSNFRHDELYGNNQIAKKAHADALAKAAEDKPNDPDLLFLLGVRLHFDGQPDRAAPFFQQAAELAAGDDAHLKAFTGK